MGDSGNYNADEGREVNGQETRNWIHIAPTIASKKTTGKGKDTKGYSDITMVRVVVLAHLKILLLASDTYYDFYQTKHTTTNHYNKTLLLQL